MDIIKKIEQDLKHSEEASIIYEFDKSEKDLYRKTITKIDDIELNKMNDLRKYIYSKEPGNKVHLLVKREGEIKEREIEVELGKS